MNETTGGGPKAKALGLLLVSLQFIELTQHLIHCKGVVRRCIFDMLESDIALGINDDDATVRDADLFKRHPKLFSTPQDSCQLGAGT